MAALGLAMGLPFLRRSAAPTAFDPVSMFAGLGDYWIGSDLTRLFTDSAETTNVAANGDPIGSWKGQLDAFSITEPVAGNKPLWNAADNSVRLPYYKFLSTLVGGNIFAANEPASLFVYAKLVDYSYGAAGDPLVFVQDTSGYIPAGLNTGGYGGGGDNGQVRAAIFDGSASWGAPAGYDVSAPAKTAFRAAAMARSADSASRGTWMQVLHNNGSDNTHFAVYTPRNCPNMGLYADGDPFSFKTHVKMIAAGRVALTDDDVANLIAYAETLP